VDYVLDKIGAELEPGGPDVPFPVLVDARNMLHDPGTAGTPGGLYTPNLVSLDTADTSWSISGDGTSFNLYAPTSVDSYLSIGAPNELAFSMRAGGTYTFSATGRVKQAVGGSVGPGARRIVFFWRVSSGGLGAVQSDPLPVTVGAVTRLSVDFTVPPDAVEVHMRAYLGHTVGEVQWDGFRLSEKDATAGWIDTGFFDGDTPDTADYLYQWTGAQDDSPSTRTALTRRDPELLLWKPGVSAWDFLSPMLVSAGLRLFCDELRVWRLVDPATYEVAGFVPVTPDNATQGTDTISREDAEVFATGVVCLYRWTDSTGVVRTATDSAGTPEKVVRLEFARPYPGPGAAAAILARRDGTGRVQDVSGLARWEATPGMVATVDLPLAESQLGKLDGVEWRLDDTGLMRLTTRGLIDRVPGSWLDWDQAEAWQDVDPSMTWDTVPA
jgi:hypothetical protein